MARRRRQRRAMGQFRQEAIDNWDFGPQGQGLYIQHRLGGIDENTSGQLVIEMLGANAYSGPARGPGVPGMPETGIDPIDEMLGDLELFGEPDYVEEVYAPGAQPSRGGMTYDVDGELVTIEFTTGSGLPATAPQALKALIALLIQYPQLLEAIQRALKLIIRPPAREAEEWNAMAILCLLHKLPKPHREALCQFEGGIKTPIALSEAAANIFLTLLLSDAIVLNPDDPEIQKALVFELVGHHC